MRIIDASVITDTVERLCMEANYYLNEDIKEALKNAMEKEESQTGKSILESLIENAEIARAQKLAICQDTGMAVVFVEMGQDVQVQGGYIEDAINEGVRRGYKKGFLRSSVVKDPLLRENTRDNTPAIIHYEIVKGDRFTIHLAPKGLEVKT